ncbi:MAG: hypothetical protein K2N13_06265 [Paraprevotella sp.]|nr:hypothetical protein [Paraprevotella sp.]
MQEKDKNSFDSLIEETVGLSVDDIRSQSFDEIHRQIEKKENSLLELGQSESNLVYYRGSMLLASGRINYDVESEFEKTFRISQ